MNCGDVEAMLSDFMERLLPTRQADRVADHLHACPACRRLLEEFQETGAALRAPMELPDLPGIECRIAERWMAERAPRPPRTRQRLASRLSAPVRAPLLPAVCLTILIVGFGIGVWSKFLSVEGKRGEFAGVRTPHPSTHLVGTRGAPDMRTGRPHSGNASGPAPLPPPSVNPRGRHLLITARSPSIVGRRSHQSNAPSGSQVPPLQLAKGTASTLPSASGTRGIPDDLAALNGARASGAAPSLALPLELKKQRYDSLRRRLPAPDNFIQAALPRLADVTGQQIAAAADAYKREATAVDPRLAHPVTLDLKATALSDLCAHLQKETGIHLTAGPSVADEKVTLFYNRAPLRDVMRELSGPFGYTWLRSGSAFRRSGVQAFGKDGTDPNIQHPRPNAGYRYELEQDLRSQLLEEELRNRDRDAALLALDRDVERCRPYLDLSPDEALARAKKAPAADKKLLEQLAGTGWGAAQMYFRLSPDEMAELRAGRALVFGSNVTPDPLGRPSFDGRRTADSLDFILRPLPPDLARGALQSLRDWRVDETSGAAHFGTAQDVPHGVPVTSWSGARPAVMLLLRQDERGQYTLFATAGLAFGPDETRYKLYGGEPLATGLSPSVARPDNQTANARLARDPTLQPVITVEPQASCGGFRSPVLASLLRQAPSPPQTGKEASDMTPRKVTTADVLEALHRATGLNLAADYYTRLYTPESVTLHNVKLFDALNQLADTMRMRWSKEGDWIRFRTIAYYNDHLKEVPNRLLERWAASRTEHGALTLDDLIEIAQLSDTQLDSQDMGEGAWLCYGLEEWFMASHPMRYHLRFLSSLSPAQRRLAQSAAGLPFPQMSLPQQQQFLALAVEKDDLQKLRLADLGTASLRVQYTPPGEFQWVRPQPPGSPSLPSPVLEPTREAALAGARRIDPGADATQIAATDVHLVFVYTVSATKSRRVASP